MPARCRELISFHSHQSSHSEHSPTSWALSSTMRWYAWSSAVAQLKSSVYLAHTLSKVPSHREPTLRVGSEEGLLVGKVVGADVGAVVGTAVGAKVGAEEGSPEGTPVGMEVGSEGIEVGSPEGCVEGADEGSPDGLVVGTAEGMAVGCPEG